MAERVEGVPRDVSVVMPMLVCSDVASVIDFCKATFGAEEKLRLAGPDGTVAHAAVTVRDAFILLEGETPGLASRPPTRDGSSPVVVHVYVPDVDRAVERAVAAGAELLLPVEDHFYGDRSGRVMDPSGHVWLISSRIAAVPDSLDEVEERWREIDGSEA